MKQRIRFAIAKSLHFVFPRRFCWANLAMWAMGYKMGEPVSECQKQDRCYCGQWINGRHVSEMSKEELAALAPTEEELNELPF